MSDDHSNRVGWFLAGLGLGIGSAILYASKSRQETSKTIVTTAGDSPEYVASRGRNANERFSNGVDSGRDMINRDGDPGKSTVEKKHEAVHDEVAAKCKAQLSSRPPPQNAGSGINE